MSNATFKRATVGGRVETFVDGRGLAELILAGLGGELSYLGGDAAQTAVELEGELTLDSVAGVDLRARLVGAACFVPVDWDNLTPAELEAIIEADLRSGLSARISDGARWAE